MSDWNEPYPAPLVYPSRQVHTNSELALKHYASKLGLTIGLQRVAPAHNAQRRPTGTFLPADRSEQLANPFPRRPEEWLRQCDDKPNKQDRSTQTSSGASSSSGWIKCLSTLLGIFLGLLLSLGAIIPVLILSKASVSTSQTATTTVASLSGSPVVPSLITSSYIAPSCGLYFCEQQVYFATNMTIIELLVTITVQRTGNATYQNAYTNNSPPMSFNHTASSSEIVYAFFLQGGQLSAGNYSVTAQFTLSNSNHTSSIDRYSVSIKNICGNVATASGYF